MKTLLKSFFVLGVALITLNTNVHAQTPKSFKGIATFNLAYSGNIDAATAAQQPKLLTISILGNKQKLSMAAGPVTFDVISDGDKKETITLIDMMGQKKYYKSNEAEITEEYSKNGVPVIRYLEETKVIAGYTCKKAEYVAKDEDGNESTTVIYYTEELGSEALNFGTNLQGLKGFPLEYVVTQKEIITTFSASEVKKGKVKDTDFMIPSDYTEFTAEEKEQMKAALSGKE